MEKQHLEKIREILLNMEKDLLNQKDEPIVSERLADAVDAASADNGTSFALHLNNRKLAYLAKIRNSLKKIENNTYGFCEECEDTITLKRLIARPTARLCLDCQSDLELFERKEKEKLKGGGILENWEEEA